MNTVDTYLDSFKADSCESLKFHYVMKKESLEDYLSFQPEMTHQLFGENEMIFGYKGLNINVYYQPATMDSYLEVNYDEVIDSVMSQGVKADDINRRMVEAHQHSFIESKDKFLSLFPNQSTFVPFGKFQKTFECKDKRSFDLFYIDDSDERFSDFKSYHAKVQPFNLYYVDAASFIDSGDNKWCYYLIYEKSVAKDVPYAFAGLMTVYQFYAYPRQVRPRISQVFILPPYRKMGLATGMLEHFYDMFVPRENVRDITVEDPSNDFRRIRDFLDCKRFLQDETCRKALDNPKFHFSESSIFSEVLKGLSPLIYERFKLSRAQIRRVISILQLYQLPRTEKSRERYVKALMSQTRKTLKCYASATLPSNIPSECTEQQLKENVDHLIDLYMAVVERLDSVKEAVSASNR